MTTTREKLQGWIEFLNANTFLSLEQLKEDITGAILQIGAQERVIDNIRDAAKAELERVTYHYENIIRGLKHEISDLQKQLEAENARAWVKIDAASEKLSKGELCVHWCECAMFEPLQVSGNSSCSRCAKRAKCSMLPNCFTPEVERGCDSCKYSVRSGSGIIVNCNHPDNSHGCPCGQYPLWEPK